MFLGGFVCGLPVFAFGFLCLAAKFSASRHACLFLVNENFSNVHFLHLTVKKQGAHVR